MEKVVNFLPPGIVLCSGGLPTKPMSVTEFALCASKSTMSSEPPDGDSGACTDDMARAAIDSLPNSTLSFGKDRAALREAAAQNRAVGAYARTGLVAELTAIATARMVAD